MYFHNFGPLILKITLHGDVQVGLDGVLVFRLHIGHNPVERPAPKNAVLGLNDEILLLSMLPKHSIII